MFGLLQPRHRRILIATQDVFFSHLLGPYWGTHLRLEASDSPDYDVCVLAGTGLESEHRPVLLLDLAERRGCYDAGLHWRRLIDEHERTGHAWDDRMPDPVPVPYSFEEWVLDRIGDLVQILAREQLSQLIEEAADTDGESEHLWRSLRARTLEVDARLSDPSSPLSGLLLARCELALGDRDGARKRVLRATREWGWSQMIDRQNQRLIGPLLGHWESLWCRRLKPLMRHLMKLDRTQQQMEFHLWLVAQEQPYLMKTWSSAIRSGERRPDLLAWYAGHMNPCTMADSAIGLLEQAMRLQGESSDLLAMLSSMLWSAGQERRAVQVDARLRRKGFELGVQGQIEEYLTLYNRISAQQRATARIPLSERGNVTRILELESLLNRYWSSEPLREAARRRRGRSHPAAPLPGGVDVWDRLTAEHRFVCGGSLLWVTMWRDASKYGPAIHRMREVCSDWELVRLIHASNRASLEALLSNGCGALLDSADPEALQLAHRIATRALTELPEPELSDLNYQYACVFARTGDADRALDLIRRCLAAGESSSVIRDDSDFDSIRDDRRFEALLAS